METRHFVTLLDWMRSLGLKGNELITYAIIYGFSQDADSDFHGSVAYIADWCGISRQQTLAILQKLTEAGHILKTSDPGRPAHYRAAAVGEGVKFPYPSNDLTWGVKKLDMGCQETLPNNKGDNKEDNKDTPVLSPRTREKLTFGEYVLLTEEEHAKLVQRFGAEDTARMIEILDGYLANPKQRKRYESHYKVIPGWPHDRLEEEKLRKQRLKNAQEAGQRVNGQQMYSGYGAAGLAASKRLEELLKQN